MRPNTTTPRRVRWAALAVVPLMGPGLLLAGPAPTTAAAPSSGAVAASGTLSATPLAAARPSADKPNKPKHGKGDTSKKPKKKKAYTPRSGVLFNDPKVPGRVRVILNHVIRSIRSTPKGERIRIVTWNFDDVATAKALAAAHRRGVTVQVLAAISDRDWVWKNLRRTLKKKQRINGNWHTSRSFAKRCANSCRGKGGWLHTKFYLFTRAGKARDVVMFGSSNLAPAAGNRQWNDLVTVADNNALIRQYGRAFAMMRRDKPMKRPFKTMTTPAGKYQSYFLPARHPKPGPLLKHLRKVKCKGTTDAAGTKRNRTRIRIAIAGWFDAYGTRIAHRVRKLWDRGCDVKVVTTLTGRGINRELGDPRGRGPVPTREVITDLNYDGVPDEYLHLKYLTINGRYGKSRAARLVFTGSANWTAVSMGSDELIVRIRSKRLNRAYERHVDRLYASPWADPLWGPGSRSATGLARPEIDRSEILEQD